MIGQKALTPHLKQTLLLLLNEHDIPRLNIEFAWQFLNFFNQLSSIRYLSDTLEEVKIITFMKDI